MLSPGDTLTVIPQDEAGNVGEGVTITVPSDEAAKTDDTDELPDTGVAAAPIGIAATILLVLGSVLVFAKRRAK